MQIWRIESRNHPLIVNTETTTIRSLIFATSEPNTLHGRFSLQHLTTFTAMLSRGLYGTSNFRMYVDMWPIQLGASSQTSILGEFPKISPLCSFEVLQVQQAELAALQLKHPTYSTLGTVA